MIDTSDQSGFSAVELLITLLVAAIFLIAGYQLWIQVIDDGARAERDALASGVAYEYAQKHRAASGSCTDTAPNPNNASISITGLTNPTVTVDIDCPYSSAPLNGISRTTATVTYGPSEERRSVHHAVFSR